MTPAMIRAAHCVDMAQRINKKAKAALARGDTDLVNRLCAESDEYIAIAAREIEKCL